MSDVFGNYELVRKIATGGMAEVFLAKRLGELGGFSKRVAIKRMFSHMTDDPEARNMFLDEAKIAAQLSHPNIVQVYELGQEGEHLYIVMEYVHGRDLRRVLDTARDLGALPIHMAVSVVAQAAAGLHHAHFQHDDSGNPMNVVHRDVSPQNVLVAIDGHVKLCDFGIARAEDRLHHTKQGQFKGKISYMSPEQFETSEIDHRTDIYGLGVLLYEATTGQRLYDADTDLEMLRLLSIGDFKLPSVASPGFPPDLERIILKAIARDPDERYQTAQEFQLALEDWMESNASRVSPLQLGRFMQTLFPELSDPKTRTAEHERVVLPVEHMEKTVTAPESFEATMMSEEPQEEPEEPTQQSSEWDEPEPTMILPDHDNETAEMDAFSRDAIRQELERNVEREKAALPPASTLPSLAGLVPKQAPASAPPAAAPPIAQPEEPLPAFQAPEPSQAPAQTQAPAQAHAAPPAAQGPPRQQGPPQATVPPGQRPPPGVKPPPAATKRAPTAQSATESDFSSDVPEHWQPERRKGPIFVAGGIAVLILLGFLVFYISITTDSQITRDAEATRIDPALLEEEPIPEPTMVTVALESNPPGATWVVNGLLADARGSEVKVRDGVENHVTALLDGYRATHLKVPGTPSSSPRIVEMRPMPSSSKLASLAIVSEPSEAVIYLNGVEAGRTPATLQGLSTDTEHHVELRREGRFGYAGLIQLVPESENLVKAELPPVESVYRNFVEVIYGVIPRMSSVEVNGELTAQTPFRKNYPRGQVLQISFDEPDHAQSTRVAALDHVAVMEFRHFLQPMAREVGTISVEVQPEGGTLYIGANAHGTSASKVKLKEGKYPVVIEHLGQRLRAVVEVEPKTHVDYVLSISGDQVSVSRK